MRRHTQRRERERETDRERESVCSEAFVWREKEVGIFSQSFMSENDSSPTYLRMLHTYVLPCAHNTIRTDIQIDK
jgi:hypothetical protein